jgi:2,4-dienoyl-CoA reductase (NADPH2)
MADANLVAKARAGTPERIRPCVLCNQTCMVRDNRNPIVTCIVNPLSGHEWEDPQVVYSATISSDLQVVGGGPAGLEAARVAALRGHNVTLFEESDRLGGALHEVAKLPGRARFARFAEWLELDARERGVIVKTSTRITPGDLSHTSHVIVACGSRAGDPTYELSDSAAVWSAIDVLKALDSEGSPSEGALPEGDVLVWDPIGGPIGVGVAELLLRAGFGVHLATPDYIIGNELARSGDLGPANARLAQAGVTAHKRCNLVSVAEGSAVLADRFSASTTEVPVDWVVDAGHRLGEDSLFTMLSEAGLKASAAGDGVAPRTVHEAVREGRRRVLELG